MNTRHTGDERLQFILCDCGGVIVLERGGGDYKNTAQAQNGRACNFYASAKCIVLHGQMFVVWPLL